MPASAITHWMRLSAYQVGDWFQLPVQMRRPVWTEPYYDEGGGNIVMATYASPVHLRHDPVRVSAVVTGDVSLAFLTDMLASLPVGEKGYAFLVSSTGRFLAHPTRSLVMRETILGIADSRHDPVLRDAGERMLRGESGFVPILSLSSRAPSFLAFVPVPPSMLRPTSSCFGSGSHSSEKGEVSGSRWRWRAGR